jgi:[acyl-carrier-protein] S-malonyltransferase
MALVFMFPGENSGYAGMIGKFAAMHPANGVLLEQASDILHRDLRAHYSLANPQMFARSRDVQIGIFLASHMLMCSLRRVGIDAVRSLGLGVGEYNHLVHIGALTVEDALNLLEERGNAYDAAPQGLTASVFPIELPALEAALKRVSAAGVCWVALHRAPREYAISGDGDSVELVLEALENEYVKHTYLSERLALHSPLMAEAARRFHEALERAGWAAPRLPYLPNVSARVLPQPSREEFADLLARQLCQPVLWRESLDLAAAAVSAPFLVEVGPKSILHGLAAEPWLTCPIRTTDTGQHFMAHFDRLVAELNLGKRDPAA